MSHNDEHWGQEDEIVRRLRAERPEASPLELDRIKTTAMAKAAKPSRVRGASVRGRTVALLTVGVMAGGAGATVAATSGSTTSVGAATAEYKPCTKGSKENQEKCRRLFCHKVWGANHKAYEHCVLEYGFLPFPPPKPPHHHHHH